MTDDSDAERTPQNQHRKPSPHYELLVPLLPPGDPGKKEKFLSNYLLLQQRIQQRRRLCEKNSAGVRSAPSYRQDFLRDTDEDEKLAFGSPIGSTSDDGTAQRTDDEQVTCCDHGAPCCQGIIEDLSRRLKAGEERRPQSSKTSASRDERVSYPLTTSGFSTSGSDVSSLPDNEDRYESSFSDACQSDESTATTSMCPSDPTQRGPTASNNRTRKRY